MLNKFRAFGCQIIKLTDCNVYWQRIYTGLKKPVKYLWAHSIKIWGVIGVIAVLVGLWTDFTGKAVFPTFNKEAEMTGDFRIGVVAFTTDGQAIDSQVGQQMADNLYKLISEKTIDSQAKFIINVWGPNKLPLITAQSSQLRAGEARKIADDVRADMIIYGSVLPHGDEWQVTPEFYIHDESFTEAMELTGHYRVGAPFIVPANFGPVSRITTTEEFNYRSNVLTLISIGLGYYTTGAYSDALYYFQLAESSPLWQNNAGKEVLYLLLGNTELKQAHFTEAESYFQESIGIDPNYARAFVGLGSTYYLQALKPASNANQVNEVDLILIDLAIINYRKALSAPNQPLNANVSTKVHLGLGQSYLSRQLAVIDFKICTDQDEFTFAIEELEQVRDAYSNPNQPNNPYIQEFTAEAYGRLGLIYSLTCDKSLAIQNYQTAVLLSTDPERREYFQSSLASLEN